MPNYAALLSNFNQLERLRKLNNASSNFTALGAMGLTIGDAVDEPDVEIVELVDSHLVVGAPRQYVQVPVGKNSQGTTLYIDHKLWPDLDPDLTGWDLVLALIKIVEQLSHQGGLLNCYALAALNMAITVAYNKLRERIVALPDGRIAAYGFFAGDTSQPLTFIMDYNLGNVGVSIGPEGFIAFKVFEKLWAFARYLKKSVTGEVISDNNDYNAQNMGWMTEVVNLLFGRQVLKNQIPGQANIVNAIRAAVTAGHGVSFGTPAVTTAGYIARHAYHVNQRMEGVNPWGVRFPPMYLPIRQEDAANYGSMLVIADFALSGAVPTSQDPLPPIDPSPQPEPAPAPVAPTVNLTLNPDTITRGGKSLLSWNTSNANVSVKINGEIVEPNGSREVFPAATTIYALTATGTGGVKPASVVLTVNPGTVPPPEKAMLFNVLKPALTVITGTPRITPVQLHVDTDAESLVLQTAKDDGTPDPKFAPVELTETREFTRGANGVGLYRGYISTIPDKATKHTLTAKKGSETIVKVFTLAPDVPVTPPDSNPVDPKPPGTQKRIESITVTAITKYDDGSFGSPVITVYR
jgi:hypothetical protein